MAWQEFGNFFVEEYFFDESTEDYDRNVHKNFKQIWLLKIILQMNFKRSAIAYFYYLDEFCANYW